MSPTKPSTVRDRQERARQLAHILTVTLDKLPGLRQALPQLAALEVALRERGLAALEDTPLPSAQEIQSHIVRLCPHDSPEIQTARAELLSSLDRRRDPRRRTLPTYVSNEDLYAGEATMSQFMDAVDHVPVTR